jgi:hypothetical protein
MKQINEATNIKRNRDNDNNPRIITKRIRGRSTRKTHNNLFSDTWESAIEACILLFYFDYNVRIVFLKKRSCCILSL